MTALLLAVALATAAAPAPQPAATTTASPSSSTAKKPVTHEYQGVKVVDDYEWLENDADPQVKAWSEAQNAQARAWLDKIPGRDALQKRVDTLIRSTSESISDIVDRQGHILAVKFDPKKQQPFLIALPDVDHPEKARVVLDPNVLDPTGHTAIDFWVPSLDGSKVAVSLSKNGSEAGDLHVYAVATGKELDITVPHVNNGTAGGSVAWSGDGKGLWYTRYPRGTEHAAEDMGFYQQVWFHKLGAPSDKDTYELGKELPRIAEIALQSSEDGKFVLAEVKNGDGGEAEYFVKPAGAAWKQISKFEDQVQHGALGLDGAAYLLSRQGAPKGKLLRLDLKAPELAKATVVVPEDEGAIESFLPTAKTLYVVDLLGGPSRVRAFALKGGAAQPVAIPEVSTVGEIVRLSKGDVLLNVQTYTVPPAFYRLEAASGKLVKTALAVKSVADYSDCEVVRDFAVSKDGTKVPVNVIRRKGLKLDGKNPTLLYGYGGYGVSEVPGFSASRRAWIEAGGVYVDANLRGGGEYGDAWHKAGNLLNKQNVFDDFYAAAQYLQKQGYADKDHLVVLGGSNGGLLMGAELVQHPEMWKAVVSMVGIYDMLRVENTPNGGFNVTEYGTVKDPEQFKALYAYSPYHHVKDGQAYPATLFMTGANDPRVDPWHSRKMVARLQAANAAKTPLLLRTSTSSGHGIGSALDEIIAERVDMYGFLLAVLGIDFTPRAGQTTP
jgi:prolyl oligopeptidase